MASWPARWAERGNDDGVVGEACDRASCVGEYFRGSGGDKARRRRPIFTCELGNSRRSACASWPRLGRYISNSGIGQALEVGVCSRQGRNASRNLALSIDCHAHGDMARRLGISPKNYIIGCWPIMWRWWRNRREAVCRPSKMATIYGRVGIASLDGHPHQRYCRPASFLFKMVIVIVK